MPERKSFTEKWLAVQAVRLTAVQEAIVAEWAAAAQGIGPLGDGFEERHREAFAPAVVAEQRRNAHAEAERRVGLVERPFSWWAARSESEEPSTVLAGGPRRDR